MHLDAYKIVRLFELCEEILDTRREIPSLDAATIGATDKVVQLQIVDALRESLLTKHSGTLKEIARLLR